MKRRKVRGNGDRTENYWKSSGATAANTSTRLVPLTKPQISPAECEGLESKRKVLLAVSGPLCSGRQQAC